MHGELVMEITGLELYIQIRDGQPYEHPIFADNFRQAFPDVDTENLPLDRFAKFIRVKIPREPEAYEIAERTYQWVDGVVKDVWDIRPMTDAERQAKHDQMVLEANDLRDTLLTQAQDMVTKVNDPESNQVWRNYVADLIMWTLESVDPITPELPKPPVMGIGGKWRKRNS